MFSKNCSNTKLLMPLILFGILKTWANKKYFVLYKGCTFVKLDIKIFNDSFYH